MNRSGNKLIRLLRDNLLAVITLSFISGGLMAGNAAGKAGILQPLMFVTGLILITLFFLRRHTLSLLLLPAGFFLVGAVHIGFGLQPPQSPHHLYNLLPERARVTLSGQVMSMPEYDGRKISFIMAADGIRFHPDRAGTKGLKPARGKIRLTLDADQEPDFAPGDRLLVMAVAGRTFNYRTPGVFDYRLFLAEKNIYTTGRIASPSAILTFTDPANSRLLELRFLPEKIRSRIAAFLNTRLAPDKAGIYQALLIGSRANIPEPLLEQFKAAGCMHLLAISGLHMGLLGLMLTVSLIWLMKRSSTLMLQLHVPTAAALLTIPPLAAYGFIAGMNTPVLRALIMAIFFLIGVFVKRQRSLVPIIAAAALLLLIIKPLALFTASFQLSFASVLAIGIIYPRLLHLLAGRTDENMPARIKSWFISALLVSFAATLGALPFMLFHFNRFSVIGPLMNLLIEPLLCLWTLSLGLAAVLILPVAPQAAGLLIDIGAAGITAANAIIAIGGSLPFASFWTITPSLWEIAAYLSILCLWLFLIHNRSGKVLLTATLLSILLIVSFTHGLWFILPGKKTEISYIDLGQGSSSLVTLASGRTMLIDGGSNTSSGFDIGERVIAPFLRQKRLWRLDDLIITHPDSDHYNGLAYIIRHFRPQRLWINGDHREMKPYKKLLLLAKRSGVQLKEPAAGEILADAPPARVSFLYGGFPDNIDDLSVNDRSLVVNVTHQRISFLFPGDLGIRGEELLVRSNPAIKADILLAPHHGSRSSSSALFIDAVDPRIIVVSSGPNVRGQYFDQGHRQDWQRDGRSVLATVELGTITISTDGEKIFIH